MRKCGRIAFILILSSLILTSCTLSDQTAATNTVGQGATSIAVEVAPTPVGVVPASVTKADPTASNLTSTAQPTTDTRAMITFQAKHIFLGYYVPYDSSSWASLEAQADTIDYVATQTVSVDACGNIGTIDDLDLNTFARAHGIGVIPSVFTVSGAVTHAILTDESLGNKVIKQLVDYVIENDYPGLDLDLEGVNSGDRGSLTAFVAKISRELHAKGKLLTMAVPAKTSDVTTGWAGAYEYAALAPHVDLFVIMSYSYTTTSSGPGSTAPYSWVEKVAAFTTSQIPAEKVLLGVAFYGYDWNTTVPGRAKALCYPEAQAVFNAYGVNPALDSASRSATFSYAAKQNDPAIQYPKGEAINHQIITKVLPQCGAPVTPEPQPQPTATATKPPAWPQRHVVWLEDAASVAERLNIARQYGVGGIAAWRLGQEDPATWPSIISYRQGK